MTDVDREHKAKDCPTCKGKPEKVKLVNYDDMWRDGEIICADEECNRFVRDYDAG